MIRILNNALSFHRLAVVLLALLLAFGSEVLLWPHAPDKTAAEWLLAALLYPAIAALLLHLASRNRMRDLFGLMALAGIYGILNSLLINPTSTLVDVPRTWFTRVLGAHSFIGLLMMGLFLALLPFISRRRVIFTALIAFWGGICWGTWAKWSPTFTASVSEPTPLALMLGAVMINMLAIGAVGWLLVKQDREQGQLLTLSRRGLAWVILVLVIALIIRISAGSVDVLSTVTLGTFIMISLGVLYYQERAKGSTLLDTASQFSGTRWIVLLALSTGLLLVGGLIGYGLERGDAASDPVFVVTTLFTGYGIAWLPAVAGVLGARALIRQARIGRL
ncbi:MAG: hypothetical protein IAE89_01920 [Anaerolineae bacterium]|nr:hypothetical protein [Anaerolineae bacterium]